MTCGICRRSQQDGFKQIKCEGIEKISECPTGEIPKLSAANKKFWILFCRIMPGLCDGQGGFNYTAIDMVFNLYDIAAGQRPILHDKCLSVIWALQKLRNKNNPKETTDI